MYYNKYLEDVIGSKSMDYIQLAQLLQEEGKDIIDLTGGEPDFDTPKKIVDEAINRLTKGDTHYAVGRGIKELRHKISEYELNKNGIDCTSENILLVPGAKFGIFITISSLINIGDEVIVLAPMWVSYAPIVKACGGIPVIYYLDQKTNYTIEKNALQSLITSKTKLIITNYPNNPTGRILTQLESQLLSDIVQKYDLYILCDEVYNTIVFDGKRSISMGTYKNIFKKVITVNGFSKSAAMTGWRIGYVIADKEILDVIYKSYAHSITGLSPFIQRAALKFFDCQDEIEKMRAIYEERRDYFVNSLNDIQHLKCLKPEGAFYAWVSFDVNMSEQELCNFILEKAGVLGVPGSAYGRAEEKYMRFSFACDKEILRKAIKKLSDLFN